MRQQNKIDSLPFRVNKNKALFNILKELYTSEEAELVVKMPHGLSPADKIGKASGFEKSKLNSILESLCTKGLVIDMWIGNRYLYMPSPMAIGIFEFTMMRTGENLNTKMWAELFHEYLNDRNSYAVNFGKGQQISPMRTLPHEGTVTESDYTEVLDYEKAISIVESHKKFALGLCSCRHEKLHAGEKKSEVPLETCITFGGAVDFMVRHNFAKKVTKTEILENLARSKETGLVFSCDNVKNNVSFLCQCCGCCCNMLLGISKFGYPNTIFEQVILQCLERGTLQHQIFGNPEKITQKIMKGFVGGFLMLPPVKITLMSEMFRSSFLQAMKKGAAKHEI